MSKAWAGNLYHSILPDGSYLKIEEAVVGVLDLGCSRKPQRNAVITGVIGRMLHL